MRKEKRSKRKEWAKKVREESGLGETRPKAPVDYRSGSESGSDDDEAGGGRKGKATKEDASRPGEDDDDWREHAKEMKAEKKEKAAMKASKANGERESSVGAVEGDFSGLG